MNCFRSLFKAPIAFLLSLILSVSFILPPSALAATEASTSTISSDDLNNQKNQIRDQKNYANNLKREIEDIKNSVKKSRQAAIDTTVAEKGIQDFLDCLAAREPLIGSSKFWDEIKTCYDLSKAVEDQLQQNLRPKRQCGDYLNNMKSRRDEMKSNLDRTIKDIQRQDKTLDISALQNQRTNIEGLIVKLEQLATTCNVDAMGDAPSLQQDIDYAFRDWYDLSNEINEKANQGRRKQENQNDFDKNLKRQCEKDIAREFKNFTKEYEKAKKAGSLPQGAEEAYNNVKSVFEQICVTHLEGMRQALANGDMDAFDEHRNEFNESNRTFWDTMNESRNIVNQQQQIKQVLQEISQREKELANMKKEYDRAVKKSGELPDAKNALETLTKYIAEAKEAVKADPQVWWQDYQNQWNDYQRDFWDSFQKVQQLGDVTREFKNRQKDFEMLKKEYARAVKKTGGDIAETKAIIDQIEKFFTEAAEAIKSDPQRWWDDYQPQYQDLQNEFWDSFQKVQFIAESQRWMKDIEKELKFREKDLGNMKKQGDLNDEAIQQLESILSKMKEGFEGAKKLISTDPDAAREMLQSLDDLRMEWDETTRMFHETKRMRFEIEQIMREINHAIQIIPSFVKDQKISSEEGEQCLSFLNDVKGKVEGMKGSSPDEIGGYLQGLEQEAFTVCPILEQLGNAPPPDKGYYRDFVQQNVGFDEQTGSATADVLEKISQDMISKVLNRVMSDPAVIEGLVKAAGNRFQNQVATSLEAATTFYDDNSQRDLLAKKTELLELTKQLEDLQKQVQIAQDKLVELRKIQEEIASYNFYGSAGDSIRDDVEAFIQKAQTKGLGKEEIKAGIEELKQKKDEAIQLSKANKLNNGIIPFADSDDNEWFTRFAAKVKEKGWVTGTGASGGRELNPGGLTNVAEAVTMFARIEGIDEAATPISEVGKSLPDWAKAAAGTLDEAGVNLDEIFGRKNPGDTVSRGEVARLLKQVLKLSDTDPNEANIFKDIKLANADEKAAIAAVLKASIMTGQGGEGPKMFDVKGPLNRAALVKILSVAADRFAVGE